MPRPSFSSTGSSSSFNALKQHQCCVWDQYKYAFYKKFREPKLYRYAVEGEWDLIPQRCQSHPKEINFVHTYPPQDTALHRLVRTSSCEDCDLDTKAQIYEYRQNAVKAILCAKTSSCCTIRDTFARTPLHWACMDLESNCCIVAALSCDGDALQTERSIPFMLLQQFPESIRLVDIEQRTPAHYLVARNPRIPLQLLNAMIAKCPQVLSMTDNVGETLMDIVKARGDEIENAHEVIATLKEQALLANR